MPNIFSVFMTRGIKMAIVQLNSCIFTTKKLAVVILHTYIINSNFLVKDIQKINILFSEIESFYGKTMPKYLTKKLCLT